MAETDCEELDQYGIDDIEDIEKYGMGTEKLEELCIDLFPDARVLRMDRDTTKEKDGHDKIIEKFRNGEADIIIGTQMIALFEPNANDYINDSLEVVFSLVPRVTIGSLVGFLVSQNLDVFLYHSIWKKTGNDRKMLWLRNNGSTLISQAVDTVIFTTIAFLNVYPTNVFISILVTTYVFKALVALLDTPFMYWARKITPLNERTSES